MSIGCCTRSLQLAVAQQPHPPAALAPAPPARLTARRRSSSSVAAGARSVRAAAAAGDDDDARAARPGGGRSSSSEPAAEPAPSSVASADAQAAQAADSPAPPAADAMPAAPQRRQRRHPFLESVNDATKWAVSAAAFATLLWRRDLLAAWCVLGGVIAAINCRGLKLALNQARPSDRKADPGMPSAHGSSLGFLVSRACRAVRLGEGWGGLWHGAGAPGAPLPADGTCTGHAAAGLPARPRLIRPAHPSCPCCPSGHLCVAGGGSQGGRRQRGRSGAGGGRADGWNLSGE